MEKIVVLNSGGFDSIVLLHYYYYILGEKNLISLHFTHGEKNEREQLECAEKVCDKLNIPSKVIHLPSFDWTKGNFYNEKFIDAKSSYLEYRNLVFLAYGISFAQAIEASTVGLAILGGQESYIDCSPNFLYNVENISMMANIKIDTPFSCRSKESLGHIVKYLKIKRDEFFSCDHPINNKPCGECDDCKNIEKIYRNI
ncbi:MAG: 7-cyano-7-deazaguanine synthase [Cellulosilyticum sp.]|nr:7-cyano-7-deazaguanine synthase [Cellulosilyticum sp.]